MLQATPRNNDLYSFDVVNIGRQVLGNYFSVLRDRFTKAYIHKDKNELSRIGQQMINLLTDIDELLSTHSAFSLSVGSIRLVKQVSPMKRATISNRMPVPY